MAHALFVFGTLLYPEIVKGLIGTVPQTKDAILQDYRRSKIKIPGRAAKGPAAIRAPGHHIAGKILCGLGVREMKIFDLFETAASGYHRVRAPVTLNPAEIVEAWLYEARDEIAGFLSAEDWSPDEFERNFYDMYVKERVPRLVAKWRADGNI